MEDRLEVEDPGYHSTVVVQGLHLQHLDLVVPERSVLWDAGLWGLKDWGIVDMSRYMYPYKVVMQETWRWS